ncbi:uncharacterized protein LOC115211023 isoform X1 [Octopus sinensis]|uniref:Uncharacterized protein LOC115211023 isoform X1 n=1 Tax=Octopus sinensis TaxID=2607531 RepID=A0A7E6ETW7_9MOLL|nr:uncharacterized protein LOC115211023 isoform X1 [Octopus sinensis]
MSMLTRTGTTVRKHRRRSLGRVNSRRGSAPTILQQCTSQHTLLRVNSGKRAYLTPQPSPSKSVSFTFDPERRNNVAAVDSMRRGSVRLYEKRLSVSREESQDQATVGTKEAAVMENAIEFPPVKVMYGTTVYWTENVEAEQSSSFISSMGGACSEASGTCDFISRAFTIITGTWTVTVFIGALLLLPLLMSAIGVKYLDECPKEPKIPIYLLVGGSFGALKLVLVLWRQVKFHRYEYDDHFTDSEKFFSASHVTQMSLTVFLAVWFGFGNYWLYSIWKPHFQAPLHEPRNWCSETVFRFTFWQLLSCHVLVCCSILLTFVLLITYRCYKICKIEKS